ncbi:MAG: hypothetical protein H7Z75_15210 [Ferruginibacter sp.]|nr:hypothetical protein [Cytophagales bacterium]
MKSPFVEFSYYDDQEEEQTVTLNINHIMSIEPYEGSCLIVLVSEDEYHVTTAYEEIKEQLQAWYE